MKSFDEKWEQIHANQEWGKYPAEHVIRFVARNYYHVENRNKIKILDFGCGSGANTWYLAREGFDTYAFDGSTSAINRLEKRMVCEQLNANLKVMDATEKGYRDNEFDSIVDNLCIYANKIENIKIMYQNIYEMLKNKGKLLTCVLSTNCSGMMSGKEVEYHTYKDCSDGCMKDRGIGHYFDCVELEELLKTIGFKNIIIDTMEYTDRGNKVATLVCQCDKN